MLQDKNEQLAMKAAAVSEEELEAVRAEAAQRVAAAERKVQHLCLRMVLQGGWPVRPDKQLCLALGASSTGQAKVTYVIKLCLHKQSGDLGVRAQQVYALSKERDALRRGSDKLTSATDLLREKDDIIKQVRFVRQCWSLCRIRPGRSQHLPVPAGPKIVHDMPCIGASHVTQPQPQPRWQHAR